MKIFLSSTAYDLADIRALAIERIRAAGHTPLHHEMPTFASRRGHHSHDLCIYAVDEADAVICIVDRRYGGAYAGKMPSEFPPQKFSIRVGPSKKSLLVTIPTAKLSITWCELIRAFARGKQVVTFARARTLDERQTRRQNQSVVDFVPAYAEKNEVFDFLDWITKRPVDNWIVPFNSVVDFDEKLRVWLDGLGGSSTPPGGLPTGGAPPTTSPPSGTISSSALPVTVFVEGETDLRFVQALARALRLPTRVDVVVAGGRIAMLHAAKEFRKAFASSAAVVFLIDSDTNADDAIQATARQFEEQISGGRPHTFLCIAVPQIEAWMWAAVDPAEFRQRQGMEAAANWRRGLDVPHALAALESNLDSTMSLSPSLSKFAETLKIAAGYSVGANSQGGM